METQEILAFTALGFALGYLFKAFFGKKKSSGCGKDSCGCP